MALDWHTRAATTRTAMRFILDQYDGSQADFYASGAKHWNDMKDALSKVGISPHGIAVEVGCGIGRMTGHIAQEFDKVYATDIAANMIVKCPHIANVEFICTDSLDVVPSGVDFVLSLIVFQHVPKVVFWNYVAESYHILKPGGIFCTQLPEGTADWPDNETLGVRAYTKEELKANIRGEDYDILSLLGKAGISEDWNWFILRRTGEAYRHGGQ